MASVSHAIERMRYWCDEADLGYDQGNRWDIRPGGECDCSSLVIHVLREAGFDTGAATYTGNMSRELTARGWARLDPDGDPAPGDVLLSDGYHVALYLGAGLLGQASIDETGDIWGGASGDQTGYETNTRPYYDYPWDAYLRYTGTDTTSQGPTGGTTTLNPNGYDTDYVAQVQQLLAARGYDIGPDGADGLLGPNTWRAVRAFQADHGLDVDGIPGPHTLATLQTTTGYRDVTAIQTAVHTDPDNIVGPVTRAHVHAVRCASTWGGVTFPYGVEYAQTAVGTDPDGIWGEASMTAHDTTTTAVQTAVGADPDGIWGPQTDTLTRTALDAGEQA